MTRLNRYLLLGLAGFALFLALTGKEDLAEKRSAHAKSASDEILIGVAWPFDAHPDRFREGVELAVSEVNAQGGALGRPLRVVFVDDGNDPEFAKAEARNFASNLEMIAVVGHLKSDVALPLSVIYNEAGLLFISPGATDPNLTNHKFKYVFCTMPNDDAFARSLHHIRDYEGFAHVRKLAILNSDDVDGRSFATAIQFHLARSWNGVMVAEQISFREDETNFRRQLATLSERDFDAIVLACNEPPAGMIMRQARELEIAQPFLGASALDSLDLWKSAGRAANGMLVASIFSTHDSRPVAADFRKNFREATGKRPDAWAAQGYDAIKLIVAAIQQTASTDPAVLADALRLNIEHEGVAGRLAFDDEFGYVDGANLVVKVMYDGQWTYPRPIAETPPAAPAATVAAETTSATTSKAEEPRK